MKTSYDFLCLDEHDSPNLTELNDRSRKEISNLKNKRFFGICGVIIPGAIYPELNIEGRKIQEKCFGRYIPFHYSEILNSSGRFAFLGKEQRKRRQVVDLLNNLVFDTKYKILSCFINKSGFALKYGVFHEKRLSEIRRIRPNLSKPSSPKKVNLYEISLKFILSRYYKHLVEHKKRGLIIAEARGEKEDNDLLDAFYHYQKSGAGSLSGRELRSCITDLLIIRKSQNHIGLQLADLITYPLYDYFIPNHNFRTDHFIKENAFEGKIFSIDVFPN
jgi:hypothetical protein